MGEWNRRINCRGPPLESNQMKITTYLECITKLRNKTCKYKGHHSSYTWCCPALFSWLYAMFVNKRWIDTPINVRAHTLVLKRTSQRSTWTKVMRYWQAVNSLTECMSIDDGVCQCQIHATNLILWRRKNRDTNLSYQ